MLLWKLFRNKYVCYEGDDLSEKIDENIEN